MSRGDSNRRAFLAAVEQVLGPDVGTVSRADIIRVCESAGVKWPAWLVSDVNLRVGRGMYRLDTSVATGPVPVKAPRQVRTPVNKEPAVVETVAMSNAAVSDNVVQMPGVPHVNVLNLVPAHAVGYVPFGNFNDVRSIVKSRRFYPLYITGLSGNGKTMMVEQVHAQEKRELIRVNVTIETDEDDLLGGFRLVDGHTVWQNGPVVIAMERGATLLLDEVDLGSNKMMCLQPVLEGKQIFLKKINKIIVPAPGFNVIATANTKGKGSEDGRFIGTNVQNEAMLDRYAATIEQEYPSPKVEAKILSNVMSAAGVEDRKYIEILVQWADTIRKTFAEGAVSEIISTRRLVNIVEAYCIFGNRMKAISLCVNRFDADTKATFIKLYSKLDDSENEKVEVEDEFLASVVPDPDAEVAF